jgi:sterol-4alpha-carboxylate 3-dehydrogenase (decarboxylating)
MQVMPLFKAVGRPLKASEFTMNRIAITACNRVFDITGAKTQLGYQPVVSINEGIARTIKSFGHLRAEDNRKQMQ